MDLKRGSTTTTNAFINRFYTRTDKRTGARITKLNNNNFFDHVQIFFTLGDKKSTIYDFEKKLLIYLFLF